MLTEAETKEIEKNGHDYAYSLVVGTPYTTAQIGYIAGATAMAEKKNLEVKVWKNTADEFKKYNDDLKAQLEATQEEIANLKKGYQEMDENHDRLTKATQAELERVKAVAEKMASRLKLIGIGEDVLAEYQNLKQ